VLQCTESTEKAGALQHKLPVDRWGLELRVTKIGRIARRGGSRG
jgi:hypothetical protein